MLNYLLPATFESRARGACGVRRAIPPSMRPTFAANTASLSLRADRSHHLAEALGFGGDERRELRRRGGDHLGALIGHLLYDLRIPHRLRERRIELADDGIGRARRSDETEPDVERHTGRASGNTGRRCGDVTAMARTLPPCRNGSNDE